MSKENNLNELNNILFNTLRDINSDKFDEKKTKAITEVSTAIINSAKAQLSAYKLTKGHAYSDAFQVPSKKAIEGSLYDQKIEFALMKGYNSVSSAMDDLGKGEFEQLFNDWKKEWK